MVNHRYSGLHVNYPKEVFWPHPFGVYESLGQEKRIKTISTVIVNYSREEDLKSMPNPEVTILC